MAAVSLMEEVLDPGILAQWGQVGFAAVVLGASGFAFSEAVGFSRRGGDAEALPNAEEVSFRAELRRATPWALVLIFLQIAGITLGLMLPRFSALVPVASIYLFGGLMLPFIWASGQVHGIRCNLPRAPIRWAPARKRWIIGIIAAFGIALSLALVMLIEIEPGAAVREMSEGVDTNIGMVVLALWLLLNAPWMEELVFRHYLVPRVASLLRMRPGLVILAFSVVVSAVIFALGHAGHMLPVWPKLTQTFIWGLMLGWARVYLGTPYAIILHLIFNLSAPLAAPFLKM